MIFFKRKLKQYEIQIIKERILELSDELLSLKRLQYISSQNCQYDKIKYYVRKIKPIKREIKKLRQRIKNVCIDI